MIFPQAMYIVSEAEGSCRPFYFYKFSRRTVQIHMYKYIQAERRGLAILWTV